MATHIYTVHWLSDNIQNVLILIYEFFGSTTLFFQESNQMTEQTLKQLKVYIIVTKF